MLIAAYLTLGMPPPEPAELAAKELDARLRARYLELVRQVSSAAHPERFARIGAAYQQVETARARAKYALVGSLEVVSTEEGLAALMSAVHDHRPAVNLAALAQACEVADV